jgi:hypothetical protein
MSTSAEKIPLERWYSLELQGSVAKKTASVSDVGSENFEFEKSTHLWSLVFLGLLVVEPIMVSESG